MADRTPDPTSERHASPGDDTQTCSQSKHHRKAPRPRYIGTQKRKLAKQFSVGNSKTKKKKLSNRAIAKHSFGNDVNDKIASMIRCNKNWDATKLKYILDEPHEPTEEEVLKDQDLLERAQDTFGDLCTEIVEDDDGHPEFLIKGMKTRLRDYQLLCSAFMKRIERSHQTFRGGIIADEMGMGKTLEFLACAEAPQRSGVSNKGSTLVVTRSQSHIDQFRRDILKHTETGEEGITIYVRMPKQNQVRGLQAYDYIFATYDQVQRDYKEKGPLSQIDFRRIVLDEGHYIKKFPGATSKACRNLKGTCRWILTGTPFQNSVKKEARAYLAFLRIDDDIDVEKCSAEEFKSTYGTPKIDNQHERILKVLEIRMMRREKGQYFMGRAICPLPPRHDIICRLRLTKPERAVYKFLERIIARRFAEKSADTNQDSRFKTAWWVFLTRLRQAVNHPFLLESCWDHDLTTEERQRLQNDIAKVTRQRIDCEDHHDWCRKFHHVNCIAEPLDPESRAPQRPHVSIDLTQLLGNALLSTGEDCCAVCSQVSSLRGLECEHFLCSSCYFGITSECEKEDSFLCPTCEKPVPRPEHVTGEFDESDDELERPVGKSPRGQRGTRNARGQPRKKTQKPKDPVPGEDRNNEEPKGTITVSKCLEACDKIAYGSFSLSTKLGAATHVILSHIPLEDKAIVYCQWAITARLLGRILNAKGVPFLYYWGDMTTKSRIKALDDFRSDGSVRVLIASLTAGSTGLNIQCANWILSLDPWWNPTIEEQAFGRAWRDGQKKKTYFVRFFVDGTIDYRLAFMQDLKREACKEAVKQGEKPKPLTGIEQLFLIGHNKDYEPVDDTTSPTEPSEHGNENGGFSD
ncbi:P-loop containing nucleoside triphosphate hydrolase protein [Xylariomycetidae sp. FL0641]|nr:P-loop containing nucleoside triphosphate hydrolase protein [Xylariomycetidae sp. FL0641]